MGEGKEDEAPIPPGYIAVDEKAQFNEFLLWTAIDDNVSWHRFIVLKVRAHATWSGVGVGYGCGFGREYGGPETWQ